MTDAAAASGPLAGVRVIDLTTVMMGPFATQILGDYGADVIKVEPPGGDVMRHAPPMRSPGMGAMYMQGNRNKRSAVLDLKTEAGRSALLRLCEGADVFVHNIRPAAMRRLGLGPEELCARFPRLVYLSLFGYGETGPYAGRPAYDDLIQGIAGIPALFAEVSGAEPRYVPLAAADRIVGLNATHAILAALLHRDRTGSGQAIEVPMFETLAQFVLGDHMGGRSFEPPLGPPGYRRLLQPDRRPYRTSDGHLCVLVYTDGHWRSFFTAIGREDEYAGNPLFHDIRVRASRYDEAYAFVAAELLKRSTAEWMELLERHDIPCSPMHDLDGLIDDPHLEAVGFFREVEHPTEGRIRLTAPPATWSRTPPSIRRPPPRTGEHTREILEEAGLSPDEIDGVAPDAAAERG
jgi:crotonobetainyl-CoA:carnitine CoA-transferase CaiB-like acyl-CoA transferase